jgi:hypothetical protein
MLVYVHGNCQAPPLAAMLAKVYPEWRIEAYECFNTKIVDEIERYREIVAHADILMSQPIHDGYRDRDDLSLNWVRANVKPGAALVVIPALHFNGQLVSWRSVGFPGYGMDYHDMTLFQLAATELDVDSIVEILMDEALYPPDFVANEIEIALAEAWTRKRRIFWPSACVRSLCFTSSTIPRGRRWSMSPTPRLRLWASPGAWRRRARTCCRFPIFRWRLRRRARWGSTSTGMSSCRAKS